jgi:fibronectin type 3 domain-containing protein
MRLKATIAVSSGLVLLVATAAVAQNPSTTVSVDASANLHSISPLIYGVNWPNAADYANLNLPIARAGGENQDTYNWQAGQNGYNTSQDWYWQGYQSTGGNAANGGNDAFINAGQATHTLPMIEIPMLPYIAELGPNGASTWSFSVAKYGAQTAVNPYNSDAGDGVSSSTGQNITGNNPLDAYIPNTGSIESAGVENLISTYGNAAGGGVKYYIMDNEPAIWSTVHRDMHPNSETYDELYNDYITYAGAIRADDPNAQIVGPEEWGWAGYFYSGLGTTDYSNHGNMYAVPWLLQQLHSYQQTTGKQLLNVFSLHYYPQDGSSNDDDSAGQDAIRNQSTRSLWDPTYVDQSWIPSMGINGGIVQLIPMMQSWVNTYYPGLATAITEYNWGDEEHLNGADAQADVLGIFGRQNLTIGTRWVVPASTTPTYLVFELYRNYDGKDSTFGDTSCADTVADPDNLSSFSAIRSSDGALTVMVINKKTGSTPVTIDLSDFTGGSSAQVWQVGSDTQSAISHLANIAVSGGAISTTVPSQSITLFIVPAGTSGGTPPAAPTGLKATAGNASVALTWTAPSGVVSSYTAERSTTSGSGYASIGTATTASYTDGTALNGVTYYYVVTATNSAGTGPASSQASATPAGPPSAPTALKATAGNAQAALTWTAPPGTVTSYVVARGTTSGGPYTTVKTGVTTTSFTNTGLVNTKTYYYVVAAVNGNGQGPNSAQAAVTPEPPAPAAPTNVKATPGNNQVVLTWSMPANAKSYNVKRSTTSGGPYITLSSGTAGTVYTDKTAVDKTTYYYVVSAVDASGEGPNSFQVSATPFLPVPAAPGNVKATAGTKQVTLTWGSTMYATSYSVLRSTTSGGPYTAVATGDTKPNYVDKTAATGTTYYYVVTAADASGTSPDSAQVSATAN